MKVLTLALIAAGVGLFALCVVGHYVGNPGRIMGFNVSTVISIANVVLVLAVLSKLHENK